MTRRSASDAPFLLVREFLGFVLDGLRRAEELQKAVAEAVAAVQEGASVAVLPLRQAVEARAKSDRQFLHDLQTAIREMARKVRGRRGRGRFLRIWLHART